MGGDEVSDVSAGVGGMVNGTGLTWGLLQGREPVGVVAVLWGWRLESTMGWRRLGSFWKVTEGVLLCQQGPGLMDPRRGYGNLP